MNSDDLPGERCVKARCWSWLTNRQRHHCMKWAQVCWGFLFASLQYSMSLRVEGTADIPETAFCAPSWMNFPCEFMCGLGKEALPMSRKQRKRKRRRRSNFSNRIQYWWVKINIHLHAQKKKPHSNLNYSKYFKWVVQFPIQGCVCVLCIILIPETWTNE